MTTDPTQQYPHQDGDVTALGPEIFASADKQTISWRGENYVKQSALLIPVLTGPSLLYTASVDSYGTQSCLRIDQTVPDDPRERALCRALLDHALALLDASEPTRRAPVVARAGRGE